MAASRFGKIAPSAIVSSRRAAVTDGRSDSEVAMARTITRAGLPAPVEEHRFAPPRLWRFDFAWPDRKLALEVEGGTWSAEESRHTSGAGFEADCEKYNAAALAGWAVLRVTSKMIDDGRALEVLERALR